MGRAAGLIRLLLAGMFLLARAVLGVPASAAPCPAAMHAPVVAHLGAGEAAAVSSGKAAPGAPCRPDQAMSCCVSAATGPFLRGCCVAER